MNILFLTFGPELKNHYQACFSILSFLKESPAPNVHIMTDYPDFYRYFGEAVTIHKLTPQQLNEWQGKHQFFWRIKCKAVEMMVAQYPDQPLMYVDSDTFLHRGLNQEIIPLITEGKAFMHLKEGHLNELKSKTETQMWTQLRGKNIAGFQITEASAMWNAGVIAIPQTRNQEITQDIVKVCDALCDTPAPRRLLEQFAFSLVIDEKIGLSPADTWIGHYWGNKADWNDAIKTFFLESRLGNRTLEDDIEAIKSFDFSSLAIFKKEKNTKLRIQRWLEKKFPAKNAAYFTAP